MKKLGLSVALFLGLVVSVAYSTDEVTVNALLSVVNGNFNLQRSVTVYKVNQVTNLSDYGVATIATTTNLLPIANVIIPRYAFFRNVGTGDSITVSCTIQLRAGDVAVLPLASTNITAYKANVWSGDTARLEYWVNEE